MAKTGQYGEAFQSTAADMTERVADAVSDASQDAGENVKRIAQSAADGVRRTADYVRRTGVQEMADDVKSFAKENPTYALIGAAVLGFVVARLTSRN